MKKIKNLIPHRDPFIFTDEILSYSENEIVAVKTFDERDHWLKGNFGDAIFDFIPSTILIESIAQSGGAGIRLLKNSDGLFGLASIENAKFLENVTFHQKLKYVITNLKISDKLIKQKGVAYIEDKLIFEVTWLCVRIN